MLQSMGLPRVEHDCVTGLNFNFKLIASHLTCSSRYVCIIVVLEKTLESPLDSKKIKPVIPKGNIQEILNIRCKDGY